jgi:cytochrome c oxidase subunit I
MKKVWAILIWGVLIFAIGTYLDMVRGMLMGGSDPMITAVFRFAVAFVVVMVVVLVGRWLRRWTGKRLRPGEWFVAGAVAWMLQGAYARWVEPLRTLDMVVHDTYFVMTYVFAVVGVAVIFGVIGAVYLSYPLVTGRTLNAVLGYLHFWATLAALYVVLWMESFDNGLNLPKGYLEYRNFQTNQAVGWAYEGMAILLVGVQVVFVGNLVASLFRRRRRMRRR